MTVSHEDPAPWEEHTHERLVHSHRHYHVRHNYNDRVGAFDHLSSEHEHDHAELRHTHFPHENFEREHEGEAHVHDHDVPVKRNGERKTVRARQLTR